MKATVATLVVALCAILKGTNAVGWTDTFSPSQLHIDALSGYGELCKHLGVNVAQDMGRAVNKFTIDFYKKISIRENDHCVLSPLTLWLTLAAMAEGSEGPARKEIFSILSLPEDVCLRQKYYELAVSREITGPEVRLHSSRILAVDDSLLVKPHWNTFVRSNSLLTPISFPIKRDPAAAVNSMRKLISSGVPSINLDGNSVLLGSFDYLGSWIKEFAHATVENAPFYNDYGQEIGTVELMRIRQRMFISYLPEQQLKVLVIPIGSDGRYCIMFGLTVGTTRHSIESFAYDVVPNAVNNTRFSSSSIDVAIPRFSMTSELDLRSVLEEMGVKSLWSDHLATRNISQPSSQPSSFIHRATITIDNAGVGPYRDDHLVVKEPVKNIFDRQTELDPVFGRDFIANRPFMFALFDTEIYNCIFGTVFSRPPSCYTPFN